MRSQDWCAPLCVLALIAALLSAASCSGIIYVEDCKHVSRTYPRIYRCKR